MKGYFRMDSSKAYPLGRLGKVENMAAWLYDPEHDRYERWEYGDAMLWGRDPRDQCYDILDEEGDYLKFKLQVAEELTRIFGHDYHEGRNFTQVLEDEKYIRQLYEEGETPRATAAFSGYCCG